MERGCRCSYFADRPKKEDNGTETLGGVQNRVQFRCKICRCDVGAMAEIMNIEIRGRVKVYGAQVRDYVRLVLGRPYSVLDTECSVHCSLYSVSSLVKCPGNAH